MNRPSLTQRSPWLFPAAVLLGAAWMNAVAQTPDPSVLKTHPDEQQSSAAEKAVSAAGAHTDAKGRRVAPHDTFYLLSYVSAPTDKGVEGFAPGQEVHLVEVHRPTQTLVVTDGRAQVEVAPAKLTNDMDLADAVRSKDQDSQSRITAYIQGEEEAYKREQVKVADETNKDLDKREEKQSADLQKIATARAAETPAAQVSASVDSGGYYGAGGYGYGSPYSYFTGGSVALAPQSSTNAPTAPAASQPSTPSKVAAPSGNVGAGRPK